ncbi:RNA-binding domain-containing protein [Corynebacterium sp. A21]|uniref:RNA-binding domain-containing protein n=1 Tax=Corynebacterium sp. A21 TaxID=3457318 RepID=UPI003FD41111
MSIIDVPEIIALLRDAGTDTHHIEVKAAEAGMPDNLDETISAFANMPEGGILILGVRGDTSTFDIVGVWDIHAAQDGLLFTAEKRVSPPVRLGDVELVEIEGKLVVCCIIPPQAAELRPFRTNKNGAAYIRGRDGDYELSETEVQALHHQPGIPVHEREPVPGADLHRDLVAELVDQYLTEELNSSPRIRSMSRDQQLIRTNVIDSASGSPTLAALYAFGVHPQQFLPTLSVKARALPVDQAPVGTEPINSREFNGPVPDLLDQSLQWVREAAAALQSASVSGQSSNLALPTEAIYEVLANALVHRDLSAPSRSLYVEVLKSPGEMKVSSPGGLWGVTVSQLGSSSPRTRNPILYRMCSTITTEAGRRVIPHPATGIPEMRKSLAEAGLPGPRFFDGVTRFEARLSNTPLLSEADRDWLLRVPGSSNLSAAQRHGLALMRHGQPLSEASYRAESPAAAATARGELAHLVALGLVTQEEQQGSPIYRLLETELRRAPSPRPREDAAPAVPQREAVPETTAKDPAEDAQLTAVVSPAHRGRRLNQEEKENLVIRTLREASSPMPRSDVASLTGLSIGQLNPTLSELRERGIIAFTEPPRSTRQRYQLVE